jgi:hypothetical protein
MGEMKADDLNKIYIYVTYKIFSTLSYSLGSWWTPEFHIKFLKYVTDVEKDMKLFM